MLSPSYLSHISEGAESIAEDLHAYLIRQIIDRMIIRIGRGDDYLLTSSDAWRIRTLQESGYLLEDITAELAKYTKRQEAEIREAMTEAGGHGSGMGVLHEIREHERGRRPRYGRSGAAGNADAVRGGVRG